MNCSSHNGLATLDACVVHDGCDMLCVHCCCTDLPALSVYMEFVLIILHKYHQKAECKEKKLHTCRGKNRRDTETLDELTQPVQPLLPVK